MKRLERILVGAILVGGVGCVASPAPFPGAGPAGGLSGPAEKASARVRGDAVGPHAGSAASSEPTAANRSPLGRLQFAVRWPSRIQAIPVGANSIVIAISAAGSEIGRLTLVRPGGQGSIESTGSIGLDPASGLTVTAKAYSSATPADADPVLAFASSTSVTVTDSQNTDVRLTLAPLGAPAITRLFPPNGGLTATASAIGSGFGLTTSEAFSLYLVTPMGTEDLTPSATRSASGSEEVITFAIPMTGRSGNILVSVGAQSSNLSPFTVIGRVKIGQSAVNVSKASGPVALTITASDSSNAPLADPYVNWEVLTPVVATSSGGPTLIGQISSTGVFTPQNAGTASIRVFSGMASDTIPVTVTN